MRAQRVVHLTPYYPPHIGGVERVAQALARGLAHDYDVEVWTTDLGATAPRGGTALEDDVRVVRARAVEFAHTPVAPQLFRPLRHLTAGSVVHVHVAHALWPEMAALSTISSGASLVAHFHLDVDPTGRAGILLPLYKRQCLARVLRHADAVLALTEGQATFLAESCAVPRSRIFVVPNGVDDVFFDVQRKDPRAHPELRVLFVGRLDRQKNVPRLLRSLSHLDGAYEAVIVGDGEQRRECEELRDALSLSSVRFVGRQDRRALIEWYGWADVVALSSDREGMPLVALEAMAAGLAIVATDVSDMAEIVADAGRVVSPAEEPIAEALQGLLDDRHLLVALQKRSRARGRSFTWDTSIERIKQIYAGLPA